MSIKTCKQHDNEPIFIYAQCAACEIQRYRNQVDGLKSENELLRNAAVKVIEMNRQHAEDQYGDSDKAESWSCVTVLRDALGQEDQS